ncbi:MAG: (2Fe-2S)-binding protein [Firmicutes bacterium]|nr:(2Fe-2S)-binding protein [Bacillota bacterium]
MEITFEVNGQSHNLAGVAPLESLAVILRDRLGLTGTKIGCATGHCGACSVLIDERLVNACLVPAAQLQGHQVTTVEGLETSEGIDNVQQAFVEAGAVQCGFCTAGMEMAAHALLSALSNPTKEQIRSALTGNLCRCTGYQKIVDAVYQAAIGLKGV